MPELVNGPFGEGLTVARWLELIQEAWREQDHPRGFGGKFGHGTGTAKADPPKKGTRPAPQAAGSKTSAPKAATSKAATSKKAAPKQAPAPKPSSAKNQQPSDDHHAAWRKSLTPAQSKALTGYQGADYELMQSALRKGKGEAAFDADDLARAARANRHLNDAIRKAPPTTEPMTVHRTMSAEQASTLKAGSRVGDLGFVSTSRTPRKASKGNATVEITLPAGTKAAVGADGEMILPASGKLRVAAVEDRDGTPHVRMEFVPRASSKATPAPKAAAPKKAPAKTTPPPLDATPSKAPAKTKAPAVKGSPKSEPTPKSPPAKDKQFLDDHYGEWRDKLSPAQDKAMRFYQSPGFALMNGQLRGLDKSDIKADVSFNDADLVRAAKASKDLKAAINKAPPLTEPMTVYRGFSADQFGDLTPGQVVSDKGFVSTSLTDDVGSVGKASKPATMEITLPAGTKAAAGSSREMVLPPGSNFRVLDVTDRDGVPHVRMELVPRASPRAKAAPADATPEAPKITAPKAPAKAPTKPRAAQPPAKPKAALEAPPATGMGAATRHETNTDGKQWLDQKMPSIGKKPFTAADRKALRDYTGPGYTNVNKALRNPGSPRDPNVQADIDALDDAMAKSVVPEDVIVHRGVSADYVQRLGGNVKDPASMRALIGKVSAEDSYLSTSAGQQSALAHKDIQLMMRVPKGTHGINVMPISASPNERELLLDRGTNWVVHDAYQDKGRWFLEVEAVPADFKTGTDWKPSPAGNAGSGYADLVPDTYADYGDYGYED